MRFLVLPLAGSGEITANLEQVLDAATVASLATVEIAGSAAPTLGDATLASAATVDVAGTVTATLADATVASAATVGIAATADATLADATVSASGTTAFPEITGDANVTLDAVTLESAAAIDIAATANPALADATVAATGTVDLAASAAVTLDDSTLASAAAVAIVGSTDATLADATLDASSGTEATGSLDASLADATVASTGALEVSATAAPTLDAATLASAAAVDITATLSATLAAATLSAGNSAGLTLTSVGISPSSGSNGTTFTSTFSGTGYEAVSRVWYRNGEPVAHGETYVATVDDIGLLTVSVALSAAGASLVLESSPATVSLSIPNVLAGASNASWFDPSDLSGFYTDAGTTNVTATGQTIQQWNDKSGIGSRTASQATAGSRPTMIFESDGRRAVSWDGGDELALSANITAGGAVIGCVPSAADASDNHPTPLGSSAGPYITVGPVDYRYRSTTLSSTSITKVAKATAQVASFDCYAPDNATAGAMNAFQDGWPMSDNPESKELIDNIDLLGRRGASTRYNGKCYGFVTRSTPFSDVERIRITEWMAKKAWPVGVGEEIHCGKGFPFTTYISEP